VKNGHTQENPLVEIFASTPRGAEPTGITFSPDKRFLFMSLQHPDSTNTLQLDASGNLISINKESLLVIARKEFLGNGTPLSLFEQVNNDFQICVSPNPFSEKLRITYSSKTRQSALLKVFTIGGKVVYEAQLEFSPEIKDVVVTRDSFKGVYWVWVIGPSVDYLKKIIAE